MRPGETVFKQLRRKDAEELLLGHMKSAWSKVSVVFMSQRLHNGLVVFDMFILKSLSLVGRML